MTERGSGMADAMPTAREFWDGFYNTFSWNGEGPVNRLLVREVDGLEPATALDLGCSEGSDCLWLASQGWKVVGVDASQTVVDRAGELAARAGLADRASFERHDLSESFPSGQFQLVTASFLHNPVARPGDRERILAAATDSVTPEGHLLVISHWKMPDWHRGLPVYDHPVNLTIQSPEENRAALALDESWQVLRDELVDTEMTGPDGMIGLRQDHLIHAVRRARRP